MDIKLLSLQGDKFMSVITQGDALGYEVLPLGYEVLPFTFPFGQ